MNHKKHTLKHSPRHSLRVRLAVILLCLTIGIVGTCTIINNIFLENYYQGMKETELVDVYNSMNSTFFTDNEGNIMASKSKLVDLRNKSYKIGVQLLVIDSEYRIILTNVENKEGENEDSLINRIREIFFEINGNKKSLIEKSKNFEMYTYVENDTKVKYMEMWGELQCGYFFIMRIPTDSISEVVSITNKFYMYVGILISVFGIIFILIATMRFTKPIKNLADISEKMSNLEFDVRYTGNMDDEIGVLGNSMNKMSSKLEETISELKTANNELKKDIEKKEKIDEMRKEFISNVSHELKTPIAIIQGYAEGLKECVNDDEESKNFYCDVISDEALKMNRMVAKLLTLNQLEFGYGTVEYERFDIVSLIGNVLSSTAILLEEKNAKVFFDSDREIFVWADQLQIEEVITNYISNALNHLEYENEIKIDINVKNEITRVSVYNSGKNIPDDSLDRIWEKFYKVDKARTHEYGGSGIGLSIVKAIMESMHMKCGVENKEHGVEFWFEVESDTENK